MKKLSLTARQRPSWDWDDADLTKRATRTHQEITRELDRFRKSTGTKFKDEDAFLYEVGFHLLYDEWCATAKISDVVNDLSAMITVTERFIEICKYSTSDLVPAPIEDVIFPSEFGTTMRSGAQAAELVLAQLKSALQGTSRRKRGGKKRIDESGMLGRIAFNYERCLGIKPASTPGGLFSNIVIHMRAHQLRKPVSQIKDVQKIARNAIKAIEQYRTKMPA